MSAHESSSSTSSSVGLPDYVRIVQIMPAEAIPLPVCSLTGYETSTGGVRDYTCHILYGRQGIRDGFHYPPMPQKAKRFGPHPFPAQDWRLLTKCPEWDRGDSFGLGQLQQLAIALLSYRKSV